MRIHSVSSARRALFASIGVIFVGLAIVGVFVPGMPTTVFVIAASYLFARSSPTLEAWLDGNRLLGPSLQRFRESGGMPRRAKLVALASMWMGLGISWFALAGVGRGPQMTALFLGLVGTATILFYVRTITQRPTVSA